jgi:ABC-type Mn2+/Zn2+ transport system ATPase subunit
LKGIVGQMRPAEGMIERADLGRGGIAYLPQHAEIERRFPISVVGTVLLGLWRQIGWAGAASEAMREAAHKAVRRSRCQLSTKRRRSSLVRQSTEVNGSSSRISSAS